MSQMSLPTWQMTKRTATSGRHDSCHHSLRDLDYAIQMAFSNFSASLFHVTVGGQNVFYNPFTRTCIHFFYHPLFFLIIHLFIYPAPPTNQSTDRQWTIGPIYYSALVMAETPIQHHSHHSNRCLHFPRLTLFQGASKSSVVGLQRDHREVFVIILHCWSRW
jgi:hypothetical protein